MLYSYTLDCVAFNSKPRGYIARQGGGWVDKLLTTIPTHTHKILQGCTIVYIAQSTEDIIYMYSGTPL